MVLTARQERMLRKLVDVFLDENSRINLSAHRTSESCWTGNILDSLAFLDVLSPGPNPEFRIPSDSLLDLGTGGGFPALPLAICLPGMTVTAMDATRKKVDAVRRIADRLALPNLRTLVGRAEDIGRMPQHRARYDIVTSRAVAALSTLLEFCVPLARVGGCVVLWKSMDIDEELRTSANAQKQLHCSLVQTHRYDLGGNWGTRQLLVFRKDKATPAAYPRRTGLPGKDPL
ncbi:MAG: 16S rRNA (guanine527-N7)-methyltransferase [Candidatus Peregrinibacteria bacterium Gr01-1014_25]|nr:MAG: 16S rRNA (guanine527-N7)-methyltransferase [Candidatus Peregrinibacteria bacterium Gr01-1014_25]